MSLYLSHVRNRGLWLRQSGHGDRPRRLAGGAQGEVPAGFPLLAPREGSPLAEANVAGGERLLEMDGQAVESISEIQAAIRKHALGEELSIRVGRGLDDSRELQVKHVSDYPND